MNVSSDRSGRPQPSVLPCAANGASKDGSKPEGDPCRNSHLCRMIAIEIGLSVQVIHLDRPNPNGARDFDVDAATNGGRELKRLSRRWEGPVHILQEDRPVTRAEKDVSEGDYPMSRAQRELWPEQREGLILLLRAHEGPSGGGSMLLAEVSDDAEPQPELALD